MKIQNIALGIWMPRASIHLKEIYLFLSGEKTPVEGLEEKQLSRFRSLLRIEGVDFVQERESDIVKLLCHEAQITIFEEGIIILKIRDGQNNSSPMKGVSTLENFFIKKFSPALKYLFSLGAPLPKELQSIQEAYPTIIILKDTPREEIDKFIKMQGISIYSRNTSEQIDLLSGEEISIVNIKDESVAVDAFLEDIIFFKEFSSHLKNYLVIHRNIWEAIDKMRELQTVTYRDLSKFKETINGFLKTLSMAKARIKQMHDIIETRRRIKKIIGTKEIDNLKINRLDNLMGDVKYIEDLWEMTTNYVENTLRSIESLSQENIQKELNALKFVTFIAAITSFFGMNIAFPWEERWPATLQSSFVVVGILVLLSIAFYYFLKIFVYQRKFTLK